MKSEYYNQYFKLENDYWWFVGMRHIFRSCIRNMLCDYLKSKKVIRILDIGCGPGIIIGDLELFGDVIGMDINIKALGFCKERGINKIVLGDGVHLPFKDKSFDLVTSFNVMEHVENDHGFAKEINRVIKDGGWVTVSTAAYQFLWSPHDLLNEHKRRYTKTSFMHVMKELFDIKKCTYLNCILFPLVWMGVLVTNLLNTNPAKASSGFHPVPSFLNKILTFILWLESRLLRKIDFPFGVSLLCVAKKSSPSKKAHDE